MHEFYDHDARYSAQSATGPRVGIIGGGQLARMTTIAAQQLGCEVVVMEKNPLSPAATFASQSIIGDWDTLEALQRLAQAVDVITLENEFVSVDLLRELEQSGCRVWPSSATMAMVQDKYLQKQVFADVGLAIPPMQSVATLEELYQAVDALGLPAVLKARRNAYDGKGNITIRNHQEIGLAWQRLGGDVGNPLYLEAFCQFSHELAVMVTRGQDRQTAVYPVVETIQQNHICHLVRAPAAIASGIAEMAAAAAQQAVAAVDAVGSFGVEMFYTHDGRIVINEIAPRVHNSGHYTIEACACSQFENHVRAILGLPLGSTEMRAPAAVMVNLLGSCDGPGRAHGIAEALAHPGAHLHLYGKASSSLGRKMGHVTALGSDLQSAETTALLAANSIVFQTSQPV